MHHVYAFIAFVTMALGFVVCLLFALGIMVGGPLGESVAVWAGQLMKWAIRVAAIAVFAGLLNMYLKKRHTLTIDDEKKPAAANHQNGA
jgi:hypothetical protein